MPTPNEVYAASTCFLCYGMTMAQALKLGLLKLQALSLDPAADVTPETLLANASCYNCYANGNIYDLLELALLALISELECTPGGEGDGLIWGPNPETVDSINASNDALTAFLDTMFGGAGLYTTLSFGNPVTVTNDLNFDNTTVATSVEFRLLETVGTNVNFSTAVSLQTILLPLLESCGEFSIPDCSALVNLNVDSLTTTGGGDFNASNCISLVTLNLPVFTSVGFNFTVSGCTLLTTLNAPLLATVPLNIVISGSGLTVLSLPSLSSYPSAGIAADATLLTLSIPSCMDDGAGVLNGDLTAMTGLVTLNIAAMVTITANLVLTASPNMASFTANAWLPTDGTTIDFNGCSLDATSVNLILARCIAGGVTTCTIDLSGGTNAAPTGQGIVDAADLVTAGNTVNTN